MNNEQNFLTEYQGFLETYKQGLTNGEQAGEVIAKMANYFAIANSKYGEALIGYNAIASSIEQTVDDNGKAISSAKAKILAAATPESAVLIRTKVAIESIQEVINAIKSLQRGIMYEQNASGLS